MTEISDPIQNPQLDICISAGAGTGKTHSLVDSYVHDLVTPLADGSLPGIDRLVAITFTEKAALEMKARIRKKMEEMIFDYSPEDPAFDPDSPQDKKKLKILSHLKLERQKLQHAFVSTIHSFCLRILREHMAEGGVDPDFRLMDEIQASSILAECVGGFLVEKIRSNDRDVLDLVQEYGFSGEKKYGGSLASFLVSLIPLLRAESSSVGGLKNITQNHLARLDGEYREVFNEVLKIHIELSRSPDESTLEYFTQLSLFRSQFQTGSPARLRELLVEISGLIKARKKSSYPPHLKSQIENLKIYAGRLIEWMDLKASGPIISRFYQVLEKILLEYRNMKKARSLLDYEDLEEMALNLLESHPQVREKYRTQFVKIFVDEFQDVNLLQKKIIENLAPIGSGKLFVVGDMKQSIYGFRGGNPGLFSSIQSQIRNRKGEILFQADNRRARPHLIHFVNEFFGKISEKSTRESIRMFGSADHRLKPIRPPVSEGKIERIISRTEGKLQKIREAEADLVARRIIQMVSGREDLHIPEGDRERPPRFQDIALLFRAFSDLAIYEDALRKRGIPYVVIKGRGFYQCREIADIILFLTLLDRPDDQLSLVGVLRSPLVGVSDETLIELAAFLDREKKSFSDLFFLPRFNLGQEVVSQPSELETLALFHTQYQELRAVKDSLLISELIERLVQITHFNAILAGQFLGEQKLANLFKLIEFARTYENEGNVTLTNFIETVTRLTREEPREAFAPVSMEYGDSVKVMTIHQSKGLEFPIVFLMDLGRGLSGKSARLEFHPEMGIGLDVSSKEEDTYLKTPLTKGIREQNQMKEEEENLRLLYVAVTRAREHLVLSGGSMKRKKGNNWASKVDLFYEEHQTLFRRITEAELDAEEERPRQIIPDRAQTKPSETQVLDRELKNHIQEIFYPKPLESVWNSFKATGLALFGLCPRKYYLDKFQNIDFLLDAVANHFIPGQNEEPPLQEQFITRPVSPADIGSVVHQVLEDLRFSHSYPIRELQAILKTNIQGDRGFPISEMAKAISRFLRSRLGKRLNSLPEDRIFKEQSFTLRVTKESRVVDIWGIMDLLFRENDGIWTIVDYKYETRKVNRDRYFTQLKIYGLALSKFLGGEDIRLILAYLKEEEELWDSFLFTPRDQKSFEEHLMLSANQISYLEVQPEEKWPKALQPVCVEIRCPYFSRCYKEEKGIDPGHFEDLFSGTLFDD